MAKKGKTLAENLSIEEIQELLKLNELLVSAFTKIIIVYNEKEKADKAILFPLAEKDDRILEMQYIRHKETNEEALSMRLVKISEVSH